MSSYTYPGVYIQELPSAVHTITGVATSIAAFVGWAPMGPVDEPVLVQSWSEYQAQFGGLYANVYLGYAVNQFFGNGGSQAYIVRIVDTTSSTPSKTASSSFTIGGLTLYANSPGLWGNSIQVTLTISPADATRFSILVQQVTTTGSTTTTTTLESFANLSLNSADPQGNYAIAVIDNDSNYITFLSPGTTTPPTPTTTTPAHIAATKLANGADGNVLYPTTTGTGAFEDALNVWGAPGIPAQSGIPLLDGIFFNLLVVPGMTDIPTIQKLQTFCQGADTRAFYIVDAPQNISVSSLSSSGPVGTGTSTTPITAEPQSSNSAYYFPWVSAPDPLAGNRPALFPPSGFIAGIYAETDASRGVWKAPAGIDAGLSGISGLQYTLSDSQNGSLNPLAVNCLRTFPVYGTVVWGARTLDGSDAVGSQWQYVPIRRFALFLESSLYQGTQWAVFEPNDDTLWGQLRLNIGAFMQGLFQQGAFQGTTPQQAYFVKCDSENNPQSSIDQGIVNVLVGFAPLYPAEFVVIQIQQMAGMPSS
ncbi:MAG TPA: phage tail sheath C-terminal domain-containing protein [Acidobacteriaceae bacterium]|nr:phage tail sheath C-terminal domain-containing protein [Acidobacteriaceae bacterium]